MAAHSLQNPCIPHSSHYVTSLLHTSRIQSPTKYMTPLLVGTIIERSKMGPWDTPFLPALLCAYYNKIKLHLKLQLNRSHQIKLIFTEQLKGINQNI